MHIEAEMKAWPNAVRFGKLHSGMEFTVGDAEITVLCTFEDVYPFTMEDCNDTSLVFSIRLGGQTILFTGDAEYGENNRLKYLDASVLKSDFLQYPHHGYDKQCKKDFYSKVSPAVVLWSVPFYNYESNSGATVFGRIYDSRPENEWVRNATCVKKIVVSDEGLTCFPLPYTPTGSRICDYPR